MLKCDDSVIVRFAFYTPNYPIRAITGQVTTSSKVPGGFLTFSAQLPDVRIDNSVELSFSSLTKNL